MNHQHGSRTSARHRAPGLHLAPLPGRRTICRYSAPLLAGVIAFGTLGGPARADEGEAAPTTPSNYHVPTAEEIAAKRAQAASLAAQASNTQASLNAAYGELSRLQGELEDAAAAEAEARDREDAALREESDQEARLVNAEAMVNQTSQDTGQWAAKSYRGDQMRDSEKMLSVVSGSTTPQELADRVYMAQFVGDLQSSRTAEVAEGRAIAADASTRAEAASTAAEEAHADALAAENRASAAVDSQTDQAMLIDALLSRQQAEASAAGNQADQMAQEKARADEEARRIAEEKARAEAEAKRKAEEQARAAAAAAQAAQQAAAKKAADEAAAAQTKADKAAAEAAAPAPVTTTTTPSTTTPTTTTTTGGGSECVGGDISGYSNGKIPTSKLCPLVGASGHRLRADAARDFNRMSAAYAAEFGRTICVTDSYRTYAEQVRVKAAKPHLAATPGKSNHGMARAVDLCGGIQSFGTAQHKWMQRNAPKYGWCDPYWARAGGSKPEAWHWQYQDCSS